MMQTLDIDTIAQNLIETDAVETVNGYAAGGLEYDGYRIADLRLFAQSVIECVTGVQWDKVTDEVQIERVGDAAAACMDFDTERRFWTGEEVYYSDDFSFVGAAVQAV